MEVAEVKNEVGLMVRRAEENLNEVVETNMRSEN